MIAVCRLHLAWETHADRDASAGLATTSVNRLRLLQATATKNLMSAIVLNRVIDSHDWLIHPEWLLFPWTLYYVLKKGMLPSCRHWNKWLLRSYRNGCRSHWIFEVGISLLACIRGHKRKYSRRLLLHLNILFVLLAKSYSHSMAYGNMSVLCPASDA